MKKVSLFIVSLCLVLSACGRTEPEANVSAQTFAHTSTDQPDCHNNTSGEGHDGHNGFGWGHHKCSKYCYEYKVECNRHKNPQYDKDKCQQGCCKSGFNCCKEYIEKCKKVRVKVECPPAPEVCYESVEKCCDGKCKWVKVEVPCPTPCEGDDCPPTCGDGQCGKDESCSTCVNDCGKCPPPPPECGDGTCDPNETCSTCEGDCGKCPPPPPVCGDETCDPNETCNTCKQDCGDCPPPPPVCGDETCDPSESCETCPQDCGTCPPPPPVCGDGTCDPNESCETCERDCGTCPPPPPVCGDGTCDPNESCLTCPSDCGDCPLPPPTCGDGTCDPNETCESCSEDCGQCASPDAGTVTPDAGPLFNEFEPDVELVGGGGCNVGSGNIGVGFGILFMLGLFAMFRIKKVVPFLVAIFMLGGVAVSEAAPPVGTFRSAPTVNDYWTTQRPETLPHLNFNAQLLFNYSHRPLRVVTNPGSEDVSTVLRFRQNLDLALALGLGSRVELSLVVPTSLGQGSGDLSPLHYSGLRSNFDRADIGDLRFVPKAHLLSLGEENFQFSLGLASPITLPTGDRDRLLGDNGPTITPTLLAGLNTKHFNLGLNAGVRFRHDQDLQFGSQDLRHSDEFVYSAGLSIPLVKKAGLINKLSLIGDLWGTVGLDQQDKEEVPLEALGGLRAHLKHGVVMNFAAGGGITKGYGTPQYRVLWGFGWEFGGPKPCSPCNSPRALPKEVTKTVTVVVEKVRIVKRTLILKPVYFDTDKSDLRPDTISTLMETVRLLKANSDVKTVRLEGHTDHRASNKYNQKLSERRVNRVLAFLVHNGVELQRFDPRAYGETQRADTTKTDVGMQLNRRVEFHVVKVSE